MKRKGTGALLSLAGLLMFITGVCGCSRKTTETVYRHTTDTVFHKRTLIEHLIERDTVNTFVHGDTVTIEVIKWRWRDRVKTDTVYVARTDTAYVDRERIVERSVERTLSIWEKVRLWAFWPLLTIIALVSVWPALRRKRAV